MNTDMIIEKFTKTRFQKDEIKVLKQRPSLLGDLIDFAIKCQKSTTSERKYIKKEIFKIIDEWQSHKQYGDLKKQVSDDILTNLKYRFECIEEAKAVSRRKQNG